MKCLSDENELNDLLKREISQRIWFVYCNSENAIKSQYVQFERNYIDSLIKEGRKFNFLSIELDKFDIWDSECYEYIRNQITYQIRKTKIFLSYSIEDQNFAINMKERFIEVGYSVWNDNEIQNDDIFSNSINNVMKNHSYKDGLILLLVTENFLKSKFCLFEYEKALNIGALVLPVVISSTNYRTILFDKINESAPGLLSNKYIELDGDSLDITTIIDAINQL